MLGASVFQRMFAPSREAPAVDARSPRSTSIRDVMAISSVAQSAASDPRHREVPPSELYCHARAGSPSTSSPSSDVPGACRLTPVHAAVAPNSGWCRSPSQRTGTASARQPSAARRRRLSPASAMS